MKKLFLIIGAPGSGKTTDAQRIAQANTNIVHYSTGDLLRAEVASGSEQGKLIESFTSAGNLVPLHIVVKTLINAINNSTKNNSSQNNSSNNSNQNNVNNTEITLEEAFMDLIKKNEKEKEEKAKQLEEEKKQKEEKKKQEKIEKKEQKQEKKNNKKANKKKGGKK